MRAKGGYLVTLGLLLAADPMSRLAAQGGTRVAVPVEFHTLSNGRSFRISIRLSRRTSAASPSGICRRIEWRSWWSVIAGFSFHSSGR